MEERVEALEAWRRDVGPRVERLIASDLPARMERVEAGLEIALSEWKKAGHDIREGAQIMTLQAGEIRRLFGEMTKILSGLVKG